ncbi:putative cytochrome b5-like heme/steroid binding protein [Cryptosporidium felis]|nr:putative cytochrome b5-like heme/steroid binding protein [Cryptosporidium felis]
MSLYRPGLLVCKFLEGEHNLTWPGGQTKQALIDYINNSIRSHGKFDKSEPLEIEVSYLGDDDEVLWKSVSLTDIIEDNSVNIVRIVKQGDIRKHEIEIEPSKVKGLKNSKKTSMNQARYLQQMKDQSDTLQRQIRRVTQEELKLHTDPNDCWIAYKGKVYDISKYLEFHPGEILLQFAGQDISNACSHFHHWVNCDRILQFSLVGFLEK